MAFLEVFYRWHASYPLCLELVFHREKYIIVGNSGQMRRSENNRFRGWWVWRGLKEQSSKARAIQQGIMQTLQPGLQYRRDSNSSTSRNGLQKYLSRTRGRRYSDNYPPCPRLENAGKSTGNFRQGNSNAERQSSIIRVLTVTKSIAVGLKCKRNC